MSTSISGRDWHADFDIDDPAYGDLFHEVADELVSKCPVAHSKDGYYVVSRYEDILSVLADWKTFSSADGIIGAVRPPEQPLFKPNESDPPLHTQLRGAIQKFFAAGAVSSHEADIRQIANDLIDKFIDKGAANIVSDYADPLPPIAFCQVVANMPPEDMDFLQRVFTEAITGPLEVRGVKWVEGQNYLARLLEKRRHEPRQDDIVDTVLHFEYPGGQPFSDEDRAGSLAQIVAAGATTTGAVISGALYHLAVHPEDRQRLLADFSLLPRAIEEFLRVYVSAPLNGRRVMRDVELSGVTLKGPSGNGKGDYLVYNLGGANRDPSVFKCPDKVDLARWPNPHLSFAKGVHRCIGLHLARLNIKIAIETFLTRIPDYTVPARFEPHFLGGITRSLIELPVLFNARQA